MRKLLFVLLLVLLHPLVSIAQDEVEVEVGSLSIENENSVPLDVEAVTQAAQNLIDQHKADIAIYLVANGNSDNFTQSLSADGLGGDFSANGSTFAIFIATVNPFSEIRTGTKFDRIDIPTLRNETLNPRLREGDFTRAIVDTLNTVNQQMSNPVYGVGFYVRFFLTSPFFWAAIGVGGMVWLLIYLGITQSEGKDKAAKPAKVTMERYGTKPVQRKPGSSGGNRKT